MFGFNYIKASPTTYVIQFRKGKVISEGAGLSFFYFAPTNTIVQIPLGSIDVPFVFNEVSADFQDATIQGEFTYKVAEPSRLAESLDYSVDSGGRFISDDPRKLSDRLIHTIQTLARGFTQSRPLRQLLVNSDELVDHILKRIGDSQVVDLLGVTVLSVSVMSIKPNPEMSKALQAESREKLLLEADEAIYARRNTAVELERRIKENEFKTEIAVEEKRRQVRETKMRADIALETERVELVDQRIANEEKEAKARAESLRATLQPLKDIDWRTLMAANNGGLTSKQMVAMAFRDLADNAQKIGNLNISPDLLQTLFQQDDENR
jgi:hypothetical protein